MAKRGRCKRQGLRWQWHHENEERATGIDALPNSTIGLRGERVSRAGCNGQWAAVAAKKLVDCICGGAGTQS